jgi:hypothetical protein
MQWIRENLFLTCVLGALVVVFGVAYTLRSGQDSKFENEDMAPRADLAGRIGSLNRSPAINKDWIDNAKKRLDGIRKQRDMIVKEAADWNKKNYAVLKLQATSDAPGKTINSFSYDLDVYKKKNLTQIFTILYRKTLYNSLAKINLTSWPTEAEVTEVSLGIAKDITARRKAAINRVQFANERDGVKAPPKTNRRTRDKEPKVEAKQPEGVSDEDWDLSRLSDADISKRAKKNASDKLMLEKARAGIMFVSPKTLAIVNNPNYPTTATESPQELTVVFPAEVWQVPAAPAPKLWKAQLNLWITQDILAAIDATNQQSLRKDGKLRQAEVPNAAIKMLRNISIVDSYLMVRNEDEGGSALTGRATTSDYEIVEYHVSLVMKTEYLPALARNLMTRGDHTIIEVSVSREPTGTETGRYYGTDPVVNVTLSGEALFRASWTRKIMPIETLRDELGSVLGPEDNKRLEKEGL